MPLACPLRWAELANWFTSAHPDSHFRHRLIAARATPDGRTSPLNCELTLRSRDGRSETRVLADQAELLAALAERFGLRFPADTMFACAGLIWQ